MKYYIIDNKLSKEAKDKLQADGTLLPLQSTGIVYEAISGHPDIFCCQFNNSLVVAPNTPESVKAMFISNGIPFIEGKWKLQNNYPYTSHYNAVVTEKLIIHNLQHTDPLILQMNPGKIKINTNQSYTRCNLISLHEKGFITSDRNIEKVLYQQGFQILYVNPLNIRLAGFDNGFLGGCCGLYENKILINGSLTKLDNASEVKDFAASFGFSFIEISAQQLNDVGAILIIEK